MARVIVEYDDGIILAWTLEPKGGVICEGVPDTLLMAIDQHVASTFDRNLSMEEEGKGKHKKGGRER